MAANNWKRKEYETWDEAFRGLVPAVRQQSVRVAAYTQTLFVQACANGFGKNTKSGSECMSGEFADLAYKCGMYHQLGKALVPPEYQLWQDDFTEEEKAVYRKYTTDGRLLVATLQERGNRAKEKRKGELIIEQPTKNIPWLMLRDTCEQHMERWDGSGYPAGRFGSDISPIAQIVGIALELDRLASETKSETPFDDACQTLVAGSGSAWAPELIEVLKASRSKCRAVYNKYIHYTRTLPKTIPLVDKRKDRPMGLNYRPMASDTEGNVAAYEAIPWFGGIADRPGETEAAEELAGMLRRKDLVTDVSFYFLYEAADAVVRINNCKLDLKILVQMMPDFYLQGSQLQRLNQLFKDQPISHDQLLMTIPEDLIVNANKATTEVIERYLRNGFRLVVDNYHPDVIPAEKLKAMGFQHLRLAPELYLKQETANTMNLLRRDGFTLIGSGANTNDILSWLAACGVAFMSGTLTGIPVGEDDLIRDSLARER